MSTGTGPFGGIHVFIGNIGEPGPELDICTDLDEMAQRARPARAQPAMKRAFVGCIHGGELPDGSVLAGETAIYYDGESSTGETDSLYQLQDGGLGGCSDGSSILDPFEPPSRVGIFMAGTQPVQNSTAAAAITSGSAAAGAGGPASPRAQVLMDLMDRMTALITVVVNPVDQAQHDAGVARLREEVAQAKENLAAEDVRMAAERAALDA